MPKSKRGLVISPPVTLDRERNEVLLESNQLDLQELRFSLLFFDELNAPRNSIFNPGAGREGGFLRESGILSQEEVWPLGGSLADLTVQTLVEGFKALDAREPGCWSIGRGKNSISFADSDLQPGRGTLVELYHAIPVPDKEVPLQDILEFKEKHSSELLALRHHIETIYQRIISAGDGALALRSETEAVDKAISDALKAAKAWNMPTRTTTVSFNLNLTGPIASGLAAHALGLPATAAIITGAASALSITASVAFKGRDPKAPTPYQYVVDFHDRLF